MRGGGPLLRPIRPLLLLLASCATSGPHPSACPVALVPSQDLPPGLLLRSQVHLSTQGREFKFETVAAEDGEELRVIGFGAFGVRVFTIHQEGSAYRVEERAGRLADPAVEVLDALHRIHWIAAPAPSQGEATQRWERSGERVTDWLRDGRLRRREFAPLAPRGGETAAAVSIDYPEGGQEGRGAITIRNAWCGYEARVVTLERLSAPPGRTGPGTP